MAATNYNQGWLWSGRGKHEQAAGSPGMNASRSYHGYIRPNAPRPQPNPTLSLLGQLPQQQPRLMPQQQLRPMPTQQQMQPRQQQPDLMSQFAGMFGGAGGDPVVNVGIEAGPVWSPEQVSSASSGIQGFAGGGFKTGNADIDRLYQDNLRAGLSRADLGMRRDAAGANAQQLMASQQARSQAGLAGASLMGQVQNMERQRQMQLMQMLSEFAG